MGAGNAKAVYANWGSLDGAPFRVLVFMALVCKDTDEVKRYYDHWETLAVALGRMVPDEDPDDPEATAERGAALRAVNRVTKKLIEEKALKVIKRASPGHTTVYQLNLTRDRDNSMERSTLSGQNGGRSVVDQQTLSGRSTDAQRPSPRKDVEGVEGLRGRNESVDLHTAVTVVDAEDRFVGSVAPRQSTRNSALHVLADELDLHGIEAERFIRALPRLRPTTAQMPYHYVLAAAGGNYLEPLWQEYLDLEAGAA